MPRRHRSRKRLELSRDGADPPRPTGAAPGRSTRAQHLGSTRGQSNQGCALDIALALFIAEHHITENDVLAVARLLLGHDTAAGQRCIVGDCRTEVGGEFFQRAGQGKIR